MGSKYLCTETCYWSKVPRTFEEGVVYDIDAKLKKEFDAVEFMSHFVLDASAEVAEKEPDASTKKG